MSDEELGYKRVHFFKMFLTEEDWNHRHAFHMQKQSLLSRAHHGYGIVPEFDGELHVRQVRRGEMAVEILPGVFSDHEGNDAYLRETKTITIDRDSLYLPCTL